eukprot:gene7923-25008_t
MFPGYRPTSEFANRHFENFTKCRIKGQKRLLADQASGLGGDALILQARGRGASE